MDNNLQPRSFVYSLIGALLFAGTGQFFLAQKDLAWTLGVGLGFYLLSLFFLFKVLKPSPRPKSLPESKFSIPLEILLFLFLFFIALFFRAYQINVFPEGIFADRAEVALGALRILHEQWRPFLEALSLHVPELCVYYLAAGWMWIFGGSPDVFSYFDVFLSMGGLVFAYGVFREMSGPRAALLSLSFLAVMRWNFVFAHKLYFQSQTIFFTMPALWCLTLGLRAGNRFFLAAAGLLTALGLYSYQAAKVFPLLILFYMVYEFLKSREGWRKNSGHWLVFWLSFFCFSAPLLVWMGQHQSLGRREAEVSVLAKIKTQKSLAPLGQNILDGAAMFNRRYDTNGQANFEGRRMLDDVTGVLFILGFALALSRIRERPYFFGVAGIGVMSLPALLSENGGHAGRMLGTTPFIAYLCARLLEEGYSRWKVVFGNKRKPILAAMGIFSVLWGAAAVQNFHSYFIQQAEDRVYLSDFSWAQTRVGRMISGDDGKTEYFLPSLFYGHPTVRYLTLSRLDLVHSLEPSLPPRPETYPPGSSFCFLLDDFKMGTLDLLKEWYPGGTQEVYRNARGEIQFYSYHLTASALAGFRPGFPKIERGLWGFYGRTGQKEEIPYLERWDPVINFTFRDLPLMDSPHFIRWTGKVLAPRTGVYDFLAMTYENAKAGLWLDGQSLAEIAPCPSGKITLKAGWHDLRMEYQMPPALLATVNLLWKKPGDAKFEFIPNHQWGKIRK